MYTDRFKPRRSVEKRYAAAINRIMEGLRRRLTGASSPFQMLQVLRGFARSPTLDKAAREAAGSMATSLFYDGARSWREAARRGSPGNEQRVRTRQLWPTRQHLMHQLLRPLPFHLPPVHLVGDLAGHPRCHGLDELRILLHDRADFAPVGSLLLQE